MSVSDRELVVLGTASQAPTRYRNHNGYLLRWDGTDILFDPGEGTQRQMLWAGVTASHVRVICITHFHGDHCLGLPGVLQRLALDGVTHPVAVLFPASGLPFFERLRHASVFRDEGLDIRPLPGRTADGPVISIEPSLTISARRLDHESRDLRLAGGGAVVAPHASGTAGGARDRRPGRRRAHARRHPRDRRPPVFRSTR